MLYYSLSNYCDALKDGFESISEDRKLLLNQLGDYNRKKRLENKAINLVYICTHNSRRSHFGQIWAKVAAEYYKVPNVNSFSGGTEATTFNINAIKALNRAGFKIKAVDSEINPVYQVFYDEQKPAIECFSKVYDHPVNPKKEFATIMTCGDAEENCPIIPEVELRIANTYDDPKIFDNTPLQDAKYDECCKQIATEIFYVFSALRE